MLSVGEGEFRRASLISQSYSEPPLTPSAQRARKISVLGMLIIILFINLKIEGEI